MEHAWQWGQEKNGGRKSMERWVGLMWPRELPERKMGTRGGGTLMAVCGCQHLRRGDIYARAWVCVCAYVWPCVTFSPSPSTQHVPPCSLLSRPIHIHPSLFILPSLPPLFTLTVIWQAQGWQTWSWQGKRLSDPTLLGSCWSADREIGKVRLAKGLMRRVVVAGWGVGAGGGGGGLKGV